MIEGDEAAKDYLHDTSGRIQTPSPQIALPMQQVQERGMAESLDRISPLRGEAAELALSSTQDTAAIAGNEKTLSRKYYSQSTFFQSVSRKLDQKIVDRHFHFKKQTLDQISCDNLIDVDDTHTTSLDLASAIQKLNETSTPSP